MPTLIPNVGRDFRNAHFLATACDLAYLPAQQGREQFKAKLGLDAQLIAYNNTQAYVAQNDEAIVVAFRGSESPNSLDGIKDWLITNAKNFLLLPEGELGKDFVAAGVGARFHAGFLDALADIWQPLFTAVDASVQQNERPVWITGHSLGGALALMAAWRFARNFVPVYQVYTFGGPMIGNEAAAQAFEREFPNRIFRFVDDHDIVPRLPTFSLFSNEYWHCLQEVILKGSGQHGDAQSVLKAVAGQAKEHLLNATMIDELWEKLHQGIDCHLMGNYLSRINEHLA